MDISIVVPFYNEELYIEDCIKSLLTQDYPKDKYEIIMIDNNSTDRSAAIVKQYPCIRLFSEHIQGDFAARNRGIKVANGTIIAFTDSDSAPFSDWLVNIAEAMLDPAVGIIIGSLHFHPDSWVLSMIASYESAKASYIFSSRAKEVYIGYTCNMAVRRALLDGMGSFPAVYRNSDVVFVRQAVDVYSCDAVRYCPHVCVRRLEVSSLWRYFCKLHTYGRDLRRYAKVASVRALNNTERLEVFKKTVAKEGYSLAKSALLFSLLFAGAVSYELGRVRSI